MTIYLVCRKYEYGEEDEYDENHKHYEVISGYDSESLAQIECNSLNKKDSWEENFEDEYFVRFIHLNQSKNV